MKKLLSVVLAMMLACVSAFAGTREEAYSAALNDLQFLDDEDSIHSAIAQFNVLDDHLESKALILYAEGLIEIMNETYDAAVRRFEQLLRQPGLTAQLEESELPSTEDLCAYAQARLFEDHDEFDKAYQLYDEHRVLDSSERIIHMKTNVFPERYNSAEQLQENGYVEEARDLFARLSACDYKDSSDRALMLEDEKKQTDAEAEQTPIPTPQPTPDPPPAYEPLHLGDRGDAVKALQTRMLELNYLNDRADGVYGANTTRAVKWFQEACGLNPTGVADNETQVRLYASDAPESGEVEILCTALQLESDQISVYKGRSKQIELIVEPSYATASLAWSSEDPQIASVDEQGRVTGVANGTTQITVRAASGLELTCTVKVSTYVAPPTKKPSSRSGNGIARF